MIYSLDIETTGLDSFQDRILCIGAYGQDGYHFFNSPEDFVKWNQSSYEFLCHHGAFDINFLRRRGLDLRSQFYFDTRAAASILIPTPAALGLEPLSHYLFKEAPYKLDRTKMESYSKEELMQYNRKDCELTFRLYAYFQQQFIPKDFIQDWIMPATKLCMEMEYNGIHVDQEGLQGYLEEARALLQKTREELLILTAEGRIAYDLKEREELKAHYLEQCRKILPKRKNPQATEAHYATLFERASIKLEPFNFNSHTQLKWLLKEFYGLNLFNQRSEKETTDEGMLKTYASRNEVCRALLEFRQYEKLVSTSLPALLDHIAPDGHIHPHFNIGGTRTGRLSSSKPNCQNIPRGKIRSFIQSSSGYEFIVADYAQIEVRILAELAGETLLIEAFRNGIDPYSLIAKTLFKLDCEVSALKAKFPKHRDVAKTVGLSILYGTGPHRLKEVLEKELGMSINYLEAKAFIESYRASFPAIVSYKIQIERELANQKVVYNLLGRPIQIEKNDDLYMKAMNTIVQGSASDLVIKAFTHICKDFPEIRPIMCIHDEMVMEVPLGFSEDAALTWRATKMMEADLELSVPLKIETYRGSTWQKP